MASIDRRVPATVGVVLLLALGVRLAGAGLHHPAAPAAPSVRKVAVAETPLALRVKSSVARPMDEVRLPAARDDARRLAADVETARGGLVVAAETRTLRAALGDLRAALLVSARAPTAGEWDAAAARLRTTFDEVEPVQWRD